MRRAERRRLVAQWTAAARQRDGPTLEDGSRVAVIGGGPAGSFFAYFLRRMAATIDLVRRGEIDPSSTVLYAHLGGQPALNGYSALFS